MNETLQAFARSYLKENMAKLPSKSRVLFKRMYAGKNGCSEENANLINISYVINDMPAEKLDGAMEQVRKTLEKQGLIP